MKKILWITLNPPYSKNLTAGGKTFSYYFKKFCDSGLFEIHVIALSNDAAKEQLKPEIAREKILYRETNLKSKLHRLSSIESKINPRNRYGNLISNQFAAFILRSAREYLQEGFIPDVVILEWTQCTVIAKKIKAIFPQAALIASEYDVTYVKYEREAEFAKSSGKFIKRIRARNEKKVELSALQVCDYTLVQNPENKQLLVGEGIDTHRIGLLIPKIEKMNDIVRAVRRKDIVFYGAMKRPENYLSAIWFIEKVMPLLHDHECRFVIVGNNPPRQLMAYASSNVVVTGFVDSVAPYLEHSMCFVAPLVLGAGIKVKVLEAMTTGIPVLTNEIGIEGICVTPGSGYYHCETPAEYAKIINTMCTSFSTPKGMEEYNETGLQAQRAILAAYDEEHCAQRYIADVLRLTER